MAKFRLFGFTILTDEEQEKQQQNPFDPNQMKEKSFAPPQQDDGAITVQTGSYYGTYVDLDGVSRNEVELISRYREMSMQPEMESAIDDVVNEAIVEDEFGIVVELDLEEVDIKEPTKKKIHEEFDNILRLLNWKDMSHEIFRRWYIDGRMFYHMVIDETKPSDGIKELRYVDPRRIRKIREILRTKDPKTGMDLISKITEYFLFNDRGIMGTYSNLGTRIALDSMIYVTSGLLDSKRAMVLSYLNKAIKPLNQLRMLEDATVIYRLARAPERRVFYIDVGNLPKNKAEQYLRDIMTKYRNKIVYDASTGDVRDDRRFLSMQEDFWLPRREGGKGTEISTLPGGQNLGEIQDVEYFQKKLFKALGIPFSRMESNQPGGFSLGRTTEISRDEIKFSRFVDRLRNKFSGIFDTALKTQLVLKGICTVEEWEEIRQKLRYDYRRDNNFEEMKQSELMQNRLTVLQLIDPYVGKYFSKEWVRRNVLQQTDEDIDEIDEQIAEEGSDMLEADPSLAGGVMGAPSGYGGAPGSPMPGAPGAGGGAPMGGPGGGAGAAMPPPPSLDDAFRAR